MLSKRCKYLLLLEALQASVKKILLFEKGCQQNLKPHSRICIFSWFHFSVKNTLPVWMLMMAISIYLKCTRGIWSLPPVIRGIKTLKFPQELRFWFQSLVLTQSWNILVFQYQLQCYRNSTEILCYYYHTKLSCNAGLNIDMHWNRREAFLLLKL